MPENNSPSSSGIRDNRERGTVGEFLESQIENGSSLSVVSAYFTIYAFDKLKSCLNQINDLRFLFGEPRFIKLLDPDKSEKKSFIIDVDGLRLENQLQLKRVARECAEWIKDKVEVRVDAGIKYAARQNVPHRQERRGKCDSRQLQFYGERLGTK